MNKFAILRSSRILAPVAAAAGSLMATSAHAAVSIDLTEVLAVITTGITTITSLGIAVLSLVVVVKLFKWIRTAM